MLSFTYLQEEDTLILSPLEPGEAIVPLSNTVLRVFFEKTGEGFRISLQATGEERILRMLVLKNTGPAALSLTDDVVGRIGCLRLSWDLKDLKIEQLRLGSRRLELNFIRVPLRAEDI